MKKKCYKLCLNPQVMDAKPALNRYTMVTFCLDQKSGLMLSAGFRPDRGTWPFLKKILILFGLAPRPSKFFQKSVRIGIRLFCLRLALVNSNRDTHDEGSLKSTPDKIFTSPDNFGSITKCIAIF